MKGPRRQADKKPQTNRLWISLSALNRIKFDEFAVNLKTN